MPFPEVPRVIYAKNPLDRVICQLRFPPILKIDTEIPASFQDRVRRDFPNYAETAEGNIEFPKELQGVIPPEMLRQVFQLSANKNYEFCSEDGLWKVNLTRTFIALTAHRYERWEAFKDKLTGPLEALIDIYAPAYLTRVGLRYVNIIKRSILNLGDVSWNELLHPSVIGILGSPEVGQHVQNFNSKYEIRLADGESTVRIVTKFVESVDDGEICYMVDSDFFNTSKTDIDGAEERLNYLNKRASRLIQWCITDRLHHAMEPQVI
jgi:uncharacterized protein (TIGR04255 family)